MKQSICYECNKPIDEFKGFYVAQLPFKKGKTKTKYCIECVKKRTTPKVTQ